MLISASTAPPRSPKKALEEYALRDAEGRVRLRISAPFMRGGARLLRVFVLRGKSERTVSIRKQAMEDWDSGEALARTAVALCDLVAMEYGIEYVIDNPERVESLRTVGARKHKRKELST